MRRPLLVYDLLDFEPLGNQSTNFSNPKLAGVLWAAARDAARHISLEFSELNPLKNQTLSQHRIERDERPIELDYGRNVFWLKDENLADTADEDKTSALCNGLV